MFKYLILIIIIFNPFVASAQNTSFNLNLPAPVKDFLDTLDKVNINPTFIKNIQSTAENFVSTPQNVFTTISRYWNLANDWLEDNIGVSIRELLRAFGNLLIWIFETLIKLIKLALSFLL